MTWNAERVAAHEAGHAAMLMVLGVGVRVIDVVGDGAECLGYVAHDLRVTDRESAIRRMVSVLAGPLESDPWEQIPKWPLRYDASPDEALLASLADAIELTHKDYDDLVARTIDITLTSEYLALHAAITGTLDYVPRIGPELISQIDYAVDGRLSMHNEEHDDAMAEAHAILERERTIKASRAQHKTLTDNDETMHKALQASYAKVDKAHRIATENVTIKTFECD